MAQLFDIQRVRIGARNLVATVEVAPDAPLYTDEDPAGTELVLGLMPELADHVCLGDASGSFGEVVAQTELAHLLEHVTVELLARTDVAGDVPCGQTVQTGERTYDITLACPDDVLVAGALSSAVWVLQWAYSGGGEPEPNVDAIASGLADLVGNLIAMEEAAAEQAAEEAAAAADAQGEASPEAPAPEPDEAPEAPASDEAPENGPDAAQAEEPEVLDAEFEPVDDEPADPGATMMFVMGPEDDEPAVGADATPTEAEAEPDEAPEPGEAEPDDQDGPAPSSAPVSSRWDMQDVPRPRPVR